MADFVIIGGGVYGAATACLLGAAGAQAHLLERCSIAHRASGGPGQRGVRANGRDVRELPLMRRAYDVWPTLHQTLDAQPFYERTGQLLVIERECDLGAARAQHWLQCQQGIDSEWLDNDELHELEPGLSDQITAAVYCPNDGVASHAATTRAYAQAARRNGVRIDEHRGVQRIVVQSGRATGVVTTDGEHVEASRGVLVLSNSGVAELIAPWVSLPIWNDVFQVLVSEPMDEVPFQRLVGHMSRTVSLKRHGDNQVMVSGGWRGRWVPERDQGEPVQSAIDGNMAEAVAVFPALEGVGVECADASHQETLCLDGIPIIDRLEAVDNIYYAAGWCGHGWAIAPVVSELLVEWVLGSVRPELLQPFALRRFYS